jgi:hypothetical protein
MLGFDKMGNKISRIKNQWKMPDMLMPTSDDSNMNKTELDC